MTDDDRVGMSLATSIEMIRQELLAASAAADAGDLRFPVTSVTVELKVVATTSKGGKAGFRVPLVPVEIGADGSRGSENTHTVTVVLGPPVDGLGRQVQVERTSATLPG